MFHILRDPRTLVIVFLMPLLQLIIFGYAMNMEIKDVSLVIDDQAMNNRSRQLINAFTNTTYFRLAEKETGILEPDFLFQERRAHATLSIPHDYGNGSETVFLKVDASDPNTAQMIQSYGTGIIANASNASVSRIDLRTFFLFNPDMKSSFFFVPGIIAMILVMVCALLTSISISREKELGTMEQILVSPVSASEILIGKVLPYIVLGIIDAMIILAVGMQLFGVPFRGDFSVFLVFTMLYVLTALCLGLMVSTLVKTQQAAMMLALGITLLPTLLLSGFMFPIANMPIPLQRITRIIPARYYLQIIRGIMLKGNSIGELYRSGLSLTLMSIIMLVIAARRFKLRLS